MSGDLNRVTLIGRLGQDPEVKHTTSGKAVANFSMATGESWRDKQTGEKRERVEWHRIVVWSEGLIKIIEQYLHKGDKVMIEGQLQTRKWQDQSGNDRYSTEVVLQGFDAKLLMLNTKGGGNGAAERDGGAEFGSPGPSRRAAANAGAGNQQRYGRGDMDDEIPF